MLTDKVEGIENLSVTTSNTPSTPTFFTALPAFVSSCPLTMKYLGFRNSNAAIFPGSLVSVAENSNF